MSGASLPMTVDRLGRPLRDLRISVTDRCNFRCPYCMPREKFGDAFAFVEREDLLTFEEITRVVSAGVRLGVRKVRLTGGEPLLRRELPTLVAMLRTIDGIDDLAMTTNAALLADHAGALAAAGLDRVTVSLDALDAETFQRMSDARGVGIEQVLAGIQAAEDAGLAPIKLNTVVRRGVNEHAIVDVARLGRERGWTVRYIEYMDVGTTNGWRREEVVPAAEIVAAVDAVFPLDAAVGSEGPTDLAHAPLEGVARRYRYRDGQGSIGVIASVSQPFCGSCVRGRVSPTGEVFTCLFATGGHDLRGLLRGGASDDELTERLAAIWGARTDRYSEQRSSLRQPLSKPEMSYLGG